MRSPKPRRIPWSAVVFVVTFLVAPALTVACVVYDVEPWHSVDRFLGPTALPLHRVVVLGALSVFLGFAVTFGAERAEGTARHTGAHLRRRWRDLTAPLRR